MPATNLSFAKIVATPTSAGWSQAYNAGSLFIALSLTADDEELQKDLPTQGKQILNNIQAEFFGLEEKTFDNVGHAVNQTIKDLPDDFALSLTVAYIKEDTLYGFIIGSGRITLKRGEQVGTILTKQVTDTSREMISASGYLETDDLILLQTDQFAQTVPASIIEQAFEGTLPNDIAEIISPHVHGGDEGGASAVIIAYKGGPKVAEDELFDQQTEQPLPTQEEPLSHEPPVIHERQPEVPFADHEEEKSSVPVTERLKAVLATVPLPSLPLSKRQKPVLGLALLILGILLVSIFLVRSQQQSSQDHALFQEIYSSAKKDYDEGEGLLSLNKSLANDDYLSAKKTLSKAGGKFKKGSTEAVKISELTALVDKRLAETAGVNKASVTTASETDAPALSALQKDPSALAVTEDTDAIYLLSKTAVTKITKASGKKETIIKNDSDWQSGVSIGVFSGNLYILDQKDGVVKFVPTADGYTASTYFKGDAPSLTNAVSLAIDSSIYLLFSNGKVTKYTRGTQDSFALSGLSKALVDPTALFITPEISHLYILDKAASRIVKVDTTGKFQAEFQSPILKNAKAFSVNSDESAAYILESGKLFHLTLK